MFATQGTRSSYAHLAHLNPLLTGPLYSIILYLNAWAVHGSCSPTCCQLSSVSSAFLQLRGPQVSVCSSAPLSLVPLVWVCYHSKSFKVCKTHEAAASWSITSTVLRWTKFISWRFKILFLWRSTRVTCDFNDFTAD